MLITGVVLAACGGGHHRPKTQFEANVCNLGRTVITLCFDHAATETCGEVRGHVSTMLSEVGFQESDRQFLDEKLGEICDNACRTRKASKQIDVDRIDCRIQE